MKYNKEKEVSCDNQADDDDDDNDEDALTFSRYEGSTVEDPKKRTGARANTGTRSRTAATRATAMEYGGDDLDEEMLQEDRRRKRRVSTMQNEEGSFSWECPLCTFVAGEKNYRKCNAAKQNHIKRVHADKMEECRAPKPRIEEGVRDLYWRCRICEKGISETAKGAFTKGMLAKAIREHLMGHGMTKREAINHRNAQMLQDNNKKAVENNIQNGFLKGFVEKKKGGHQPKLIKVPRYNRARGMYCWYRAWYCTECGISLNKGRKEIPDCGTAYKFDSVRSVAAKFIKDLEERERWTWSTPRPWWTRAR